MKTAKEWFNCLRPDLRDRAIKATTEQSPNSLTLEYEFFSHALYASFGWLREGDYNFWNNIWQEARGIEEGRKPDIKPKKDKKLKTWQEAGYP